MVLIATVAVSGMGWLAQRTGSTVAAADTTAVPLPQRGVQFHATWSDYSSAQRLEVLDKLAAAHVQWVRIDLGWLNIEDQGPGSRNAWYLAMVDSIMSAAHARGINVLATLWLTPSWANGGKGSKVAPTNPADYANFAGWIANRYRDSVQAWEIWNEPNQNYFWANADPIAYAALVRAAYPAIKAGNPSATVVAGSVALNDTDWLSRMYAAGAHGSFDAISTHPYQAPADGPPESADDGHAWTLAHLAGVHQLMVANGDGDKPIWATEFGWSTHTNTGDEAGWERGVTEAQQADYLVRAYRFMGSQFPYVTHAFWYEERDETGGTPQGDNYGLMHNDLTPKPSYAAMKSLGEDGGVSVSGPAPTGPGSTTTGSAPNKGITSVGRGYRLFDKQGNVYTFGGGTSLSRAPLANAVAAAGTPSGQGAVFVDARGAAAATGDARQAGSLAGVPLNRPIVGVTTTRTGSGYWMVATDGGIFAFGDAAFHGSTGDIRLNKPIVGIAPTPSGNGYWMVASDGGIFAFGDAGFYGSTGNIHLNQSIVGMAPTASGNGYLLVASDGGIFAFGDASFYGSTGNIHLNQPIVGIAPTGSGHGYWMVANDGGIFSFGDATFVGSAAGRGDAVVVGMAAG